MSGPLLQVTGLHASYGHDEVLHGVDLTVERGEVVAVVGESGSGKSTLAHAIVGLLPDGGTVDAGRIEFDAERIDSATQRRLTRLRGAHIGVVPQDPASSLNPVRRIGDQVGEILRLHGRADRRTARIRAVEILAEAGLDRPAERAEQYPSQLSGGQRQRVLIGIALACSPELVIADEPTSALDVTVQRRILDLLDSRIAETGAAVVFITHDLGVAAERADRIIVMSKGRVVESGTATEVLTAPRDAYTAGLVAAAPRLDRPRTRVTVEATGEPLLRATDLRATFAMRGGASLTAVDGVSLVIYPGQTVSIVGESGSGKTTTARMVARLHRPDSGTVEFDGTDVTTARGSRQRELRRRLQFVHQNPYSSLDPSLSVGRIIAEPLRAFGIGDREQRRRRVDELVDLVALPSALAGRRPRELSGGQRQRVAIARALALEPGLVILDEPVSALDVSVQARILDLLERLQRDLGVAYLFVSHDLAVVREVSDVVLVMRAGRVVESGDVETIFDRPRHEYTRELRGAVPNSMTRSSDGRRGQQTRIHPGGSATVP